MSRSTPLGNSTVGTSTAGGGANGVPSPSGSGVHPGYTLVSFRNALDSSWRFGGFDWLSDGRIVAVKWGLDCSNTNSNCGTNSNSRTYYGDIQGPPDGLGLGRMYAISGTSGNSISSSDIQQLYSGLWEPLGVYVARSGSAATDTIYVITKTGLLRFIGTGPYTNGVNPIKVINTCHARVCRPDSVGPGLYKSFTAHPPNAYTGTGESTGTGRRWHHFTTGLVRDAAGFLYAGTIGQYDNANTRTDQGRDRCALLKMDPVNGTQQVVDGGLRSPNGFVIGPDGEIFGSDIQGNFQAANKIVNYRPGRFFGMHCDLNNPYGHTSGIPESFPVVALNQGGSNNTDIANDPGEIVYMKNGPYAGQLLYGDVTFGGIQRVFIEKINNEWQGAVLVHSGGLHAGVGRLKLGSDGALYGASQSGGPQPASGNWCWGGGSGVGALTADKTGGNCNYQYDFFKMIPKDTTVFELLALRSRVNGFELQFTKKVGASAALASNYQVQTWVNTMSVESYGGGSQAGGVSNLTVSNVRINPDSTKVFLQLASMPAPSVRPIANPPLTGNGNVRVVYFKGSNILSSTGEKPWGEPATAGAVPSVITAWYTLNFISPDSAFTTVAITDPRLLSAQSRSSEFKVRRMGANLLLDMPFEQPSQIFLRDMQGRVHARMNAPGGRSRLQMPVGSLAKGGYVVEVRVGGKAFSRPVALF